MTRSAWVRCWGAAGIVALLAAPGMGCFSEDGAASSGDAGSATTVSTGPTTSVGSSSSGADSTTSSSAETALPTETVGDSSTADSSTTDSNTTGGIDCELAIGMAWDDEFDRADADDLGNCWVEKAPSVWRIADGEVTSLGTGATAESDHIVWRNGLHADNVEVALEFRIRSGDPRNEPQAMARMTDDSLEPGANYHGYALAPQATDGGEPTQLCLMRFDGGPEPGDQRCENLPEPLELGPTRYRLVLRVVDPGPVLVDGSLAVFRPGDVEWSPVLALPQWQDAAPEQIVSAGAAGFSGGSVIEVLDNFVIEYARIHNID